MEKLSKEYMVQQVVTHKDRLKDATDQLSQTLSEYRSQNKAKAWEVDEKTALRIREIMHEILEEISIIGGFCDGSTQNYVDRVGVTIARITSSEITTLGFHILEGFATRVNSLVVDFTKTPFRLSDLKPILSFLTDLLKRG